MAPQISNIKLSLERFEDNPILKPNFDNAWETKAVFNPAAIYENGKVHLLYRAIGDNDVSVLGYASSLDGLHVSERLDKPAYMPREPFEGVSPSHPYISDVLSNYVSGGGGMGGCEDPRLTKIGERVYMTYVAYDGQSHPRVALTSISTKDFRSKNWNWEKPVLISPPNIVDKNACILPKKINGKFVIFHRVFPNILIDFVDDLDFDGKTRWLEGKFKIPTRASSSDWDNLKVGCGPPPIKTKDGWLMIYQAVSSSDESRYKIGAMLLDLKNPTKVLARSRSPILEPMANYENEGWKAGVVYPCGAVVIKDRLFVYYGGADKFVCVASVKLEHLLNELTTKHKEVTKGIKSEDATTNIPRPDAKTLKGIRENLAELMNSTFIAALIVLGVVAIKLKKTVAPQRPDWKAWAITGVILVAGEFIFGKKYRDKMRYPNIWWIFIPISAVLILVEWYLSGVSLWTGVFGFIAGVLFAFSVILGAMLLVVIAGKLRLDTWWGKATNWLSNSRLTHFWTINVFLLSFLSSWLYLLSEGMTNGWMFLIFIFGFACYFILLLAYKG